MIIEKLDDIAKDFPWFSPTKKTSMFGSILPEQCLFFDIETAREEDTVVGLSSEKKALWEKKALRFMKYETSEDFSAEDTDSLFIEKAGLFPEYGKIIVVSIGFLKTVGDQKEFKVYSFVNEDEKTLLENMFKFFTTVQQNRRATSSKDRSFTHIVSANGKFFDIPYMVRRAAHYGMMLPKLFHNPIAKPWEQTHLDIIEIWRAGAKLGDCTFAAICNMLGVESPKDGMDGSEVGHIYWGGNGLYAIAQYCERDVTALYHSFLKMSCLDMFE